jgi:hypothetical protein
MTERPGKTPAGGAARSDSEKRFSVRLRKYIDIVVEDPLSAMLFRGAIADISPTGMRIIADQYLPSGAKYTLTMKRHPFLRLRVQVRWIRAFTGDTYQVGVLIVESTEDDRKRLTTFLDMERQRLTNG